jgi:hypothetical protein
MFERLGHTVLKLRRIRLGPLTLKGVPLGHFRELTPSEVEKLMKVYGGGAVKKPGEGVRRSGGPRKPGGSGGPGGPKKPPLAPKKKVVTRRAGR